MKQLLGYFICALITLVLVKSVAMFLPYSIGINMTESLPYKYFVISKRDHDFKVGDYVMFNKDNQFYNKPFIKIIGGIPGDIIEGRSDGIYNKDLFLGQAKSEGITGVKLYASKLGEVKAKEYYVYSSHRDSLDSRYKAIGNIEARYVIGKAYPIRLWGGDE